jgi:hypothetical protein
LPPFTKDEIRENFYIWQMFRDGAVALVHNVPVLNKLRDDLSNSGYEIRTVDCRLNSDRDLEHALRRELGLEPGFGRDAFHSQMWDLEFAQCTGVVLILTHIDDFNRRFPTYFWDIIDILADHCRIKMLTGERFLIMLHAEDRNIHLDPVGAVRPRECFLRNPPIDPDATG